MKITGELVFESVNLDSPEPIWGVARLPTEVEIVLFDKISNKRITISGQMVGETQKTLQSVWGEMNSLKLFDKVFQELEF